MKILMFMPKGVELLEASPFVDIFGWHRDIQKGNIDLHTFGLNINLRASFGLTIGVDYTFQDLKDRYSNTEGIANQYEALVIPGGFGYHGFYEEAFDVNVLDLVGAFNKKNKYIVGVCVGALIMGKADILKGRNATTYHLMNGVRQRQLEAMGAQIKHDPIVIDDKLITSWCPSTAPDMAFYLLRSLTNEEIEQELRIMMGYSIETLTIE